MKENKDFLNKQILTYIGNKRSLLSYIEKYINIVRKDLNKDKIITCDLFSGSGIVARLFKQYSSIIYTNDLEKYSKVLNECFLTNKNDFDIKEFDTILKKINDSIYNKKISGFISELYSPCDDLNIKEGERAFFTHENALLIDSFRYYIDEYCNNKYKDIFLGLLLVESSIHTNTCGVFKGFYKDSKTGIGKFGGNGEYALSRIKGKINITRPVLSNFSCNHKCYQKDSVELSKEIKNIDLTYIDPPYNQHPYGSNYFMLNLIVNNKRPEKISDVSGIAHGWNHSSFNKKSEALNSLEEIIKNIDSKYILISYNNEGFIKFDDFKKVLSKYGKIHYEVIKYNTFRGSRNLNSRKIHTNEYLFLLKKEK